MVSQCNLVACVQGEEPDAGLSGHKGDSHTGADPLNEQPSSRASGQAGAIGREEPPLTALSMLVQVIRRPYQQIGYFLLPHTGPLLVSDLLQEDSALCAKAGPWQEE